MKQDVWITKAPKNINFSLFIIGSYIKRLPEHVYTIRTTNTYHGARPCKVNLSACTHLIVTYKF